jgi:SAM-dependent methyltransferase
MKLNLGSGGTPIPGYASVDIRVSSGAAYLRSVADLSCFADGSVEEIYASHILEHLMPGQKLSWDALPEAEPGEREKALCEWNRVLKPGGKMIVCVPDMVVLGRIVAEAGNEVVPEALCCIFGGHTDPHNRHYYGYTEFTLTKLLERFGFGRFRRLGFPALDLIKDDASNAMCRQWHVSLNMECFKLGPPQ